MGKTTTLWHSWHNKINNYNNNYLFAVILAWASDHQWTFCQGTANGCTKYHWYMYKDPQNLDKINKMSKLSESIYWIIKINWFSAYYD